MSFHTFLPITHYRQLTILGTFCSCQMIDYAKGFFHRVANSSFAQKIQ